MAMTRSRGDSDEFTYWVPPGDSDPARPWARGTAVRWLLLATVIAVVVGAAGILVLRHALDGISASPATRAVDDFAAAASDRDDAQLQRLSCSGQSDEVLSRVNALPPGTVARHGGLRQPADQPGIESATLVTGDGSSVTVTVADTGGQWCVATLG